MTRYDVARSQDMHVLHDGPRDAPPLLLIHGSGATGGTWDPVVPALAARFHVIRPDLPGHGQSPPGVSYDVPVQAGRLAEMLFGLGLSNVPVAGHSSGGYMAAALAERRPGLVKSIALINSGPSPDALFQQPFLYRVLVGSPAYIAERSMPSRLAPLGIPVLVIFGAADKRWDSSSARQYQVLPDVRLEMLPGVGHTPMFEDPEATSRLLLGFAA